MNSMVSDSIFLSREAILQRQAMSARPSQVTSPRIRRVPTVKSKPLHSIFEEEESRSRSPSPKREPSASGSKSLGIKARRRHCNLSPSDIQIARDFVGICDEEYVSDQEDRLLLVPPASARLPKTPSPEPSPDSFRLTFTHTSYIFPHPPVPTPSSLSSKHISSFCGSPALSQSSSQSSPCSPSTGLPITPSSSDDEFFSLPLPQFNPKRAAIQPLLIRKHTSLASSLSDTPVSGAFRPSLMVRSGNTFLPSPFTSSEESSNESESDAESDSEWYNNELSKVVTLTSLPSSLPAQSARPESVFLAPKNAPAPSKRESKAPVLAGRPSGQLDPAFPKKRFTRRSIPNYPPPPVPTIPAHLRSGSTSPNVPSSPISPLDSQMSFSPEPSPSRPPPRNSIPADFAFDDDESSAFSFSLYLDEARVESPGSAYSQPSFRSSVLASVSPLDDVEFDIDSEYPMMLPLSLPGTPIDLEADIALGLEELRLLSATRSAFPLPVVPEEPKEVVEAVQPKEAAQPLPVTPPRPQAFESFSSPSPSPASASSTPYDEERVLKSKWSSSTLASIREEHERRGSSKLRLYFGNSPAKKQSVSASHKKLPSTPMSPMSFMNTASKKKRQSGRRESDVVVIGHGNNGVGVRRRGSVNTISDAGSEASASSSSSSGLRRKPIPIELFLRSSA